MSRLSTEFLDRRRTPTQVSKLRYRAAVKSPAARNGSRPDEYQFPSIAVPICLNHMVDLNLSPASHENSSRKTKSHQLIKSAPDETDSSGHIRSWLRVPSPTRSELTGQFALSVAGLEAVAVEKESRHVFSGLMCHLQGWLVRRPAVRSI